MLINTLAAALVSLLVAATLPPSTGAAGRLPTTAVLSALRVPRGGGSPLSTSEKVEKALDRAAFEQEAQV